MNNVNELLVRRKHKVLLPENTVSASDELSNKMVKAIVVTITKNVEALGFGFDRELFNNLYAYDKKTLEQFYFDLIEILKSLVGADKEYRPMYPNFPMQVADADDAELFVNAVIHYFTFGVWEPRYEKNERMPLFDTANTTTLSVGTVYDVMEIFENLLSSKTNLSAQDKTDIEAIILAYPGLVYQHLPDEIPLKENVALIAKLMLRVNPIKDTVAIQKYFKTATDVLRFFVCLFDGDISLSTRTEFKSLRRSERRMIMDLLAGCGDILEDMYRYKYEWIRVGEIVHPFEYKQEKYDRVRKAFDMLRNQKKPLFTLGGAQEALKKGDIMSAACLLSERPGDFARSLDKLLRDTKKEFDRNVIEFDRNVILSMFQMVSDSVSVPVLLQMRQHFLDRCKNLPVRVFFPKGNLAKVVSIPNELPDLDKSVCNSVLRICNDAITKQFRKKDGMGKVYIDEEMRNYMVPFSQRSASSSGKSLVRGSKIGLKPDAKVVRGFIWWTNTGKTDGGYFDDGSDGRVDLDLSAAIYDENWNYVEHVSYTNLRSQQYRAYHSGDIVNGGPVNGKGAAEFIDIDIDSVAKSGRYVVFQVYSYTRQNFSEIPNVRFGWMEREDVASGEIFEPSTVDMRIDVNSDSKTAIPVIFDCVTREFIWCDMNLEISSYHYYGNNLESNLKGVTAACYAMTNMSKPNLYDLIGLNVIARGEIVSDRNDADIIFSNDTTPPMEEIHTINQFGEEVTTQRQKEFYQIVTAFDLDYFMGKML